MCCALYRTDPLPLSLQAEQKGDQQWRVGMRRKQAAQNGQIWRKAGDGIGKFKQCRVRTTGTVEKYANRRASSSSGELNPSVEL
ncbi:hypothetical protein RUM43_001937 [Polyplax serrata]|uniref:Uncharacterized protein n=1 Tax=Polyplax serrata TaxID=468196 RepID=A0AAN8XUS8_POLSC